MFSVFTFKIYPYLHRYTFVCGLRQNSNSPCFDLSTLPLAISLALVSICLIIICSWILSRTLYSFLMLFDNATLFELLYFIKDILKSVRANISWTLLYHPNLSDCFLLVLLSNNLGILFSGPSTQNPTQCINSTPFESD